MAYRTFHIVQLTDAYETSGVLYDNGNGASFLPRIETSEPYSSIDWTITGIRNCRRLKQTTQGNGDKTYDLPVFTLSGTIKGEGYKITATAKMPTDDGEFSATASYTVRVYQPKKISGTKYPLGVPKNKRGDGIYGYVQLNRHYHDGSNIVVDGNLYAHNRTKVTLNAASWYRHTQFAIDDGATLWTHQDPYPGKQLSPGETYDNSGSSSISYPVEDGDIGRDQRIRLNAHVHLQVAGQVWHEEDNAWTHEFTHKDNESYGEGD